MDLKSFKYISNFVSEKRNILIYVKNIRYIVQKLLKGFNHELQPYILIEFSNTKKYQFGNLVARMRKNGSVID